NSAYPRSFGSARYIARVGFSRCMMSSPPRGPVPTRTHLAKDRGTILHHLLRDHPAKREAEDVAASQAQAIQECQSVLRHAGHCFGHCTAGSTDACVIEQNDFSPRRERIGHRGVPVVKRPCEVLEK